MEYIHVAPEFCGRAIVAGPFCESTVPKKLISRFKSQPKIAVNWGDFEQQGDFEQFFVQLNIEQ